MIVPRSTFDGAEGALIIDFLKRFKRFRLLLLLRLLDLLLDALHDLADLVSESIGFRQTANGWVTGLSPQKRR